MSKAKILSFSVIPGLEPQLYEPLLESGLDAIIIGTFPTGGVPNEGKYSFIPFIRKATEMQIPVYLLRGSLTAAQRPSHEYESYRRSMERIYQPELDAIIAAVTAGGTPLEKPDVSQWVEVGTKIRDICRNKPSYNEGIEQVSRTFSSPEFMEAIKRMRQSS